MTGPASTAASDARRREIHSAAMASAGPSLNAIRVRVADAAAHARSALTGTLIDAPDGRATLARARRSRSLRAASARLDELATDLAGPSVRSLDGTIRDAWEALFLSSWSHARSEAHPDDLDPRRPRPSASNLSSARRIVLEGLDARGLVAGPIEAARRKLAARVVALASPTRSGADRSDALRGWRAEAERSITSAAALAIFTGAYRLDAMAARLVLRPELLYDDPTMGG